MAPETNIEIEKACTAAKTSFGWLTESRERRAAMLEAIASALEGRRGDILNTTSEETALTIDELTPEFARMVGTLRMFAGVVREGSWVRAAIDLPQANKNDAIGPNHDVRKMLMPLGPVAVFGASNFPLAYGVCGGDTASALAAGCPVVVKEHPAHPKTGRLIHEVATRAMTGAASALAYILNEDLKDLSIAQQIVQHPSIQAVGFTGSKRAGMALDGLARQREYPIPVYAEMGSCNPVYVTALAAQRHGEAIANQIADSILTRHGQQCTKAGLVFVENLGLVGDDLRDRLSTRFSTAMGREMLAPWVRDSYNARLTECEAVSGVSRLARGSEREGSRGASPVLLGAELGTWQSSHSLQEEIFGPATILIDTPVGRLDVYQGMPGHLVCSWYMEPEDYTRGGRYVELVRQVAGRIVFNGVPTGVRVASGMVHGGPFPATNRPDTTAVGPLAIERWCRPVSFQNCPPHLLPQELQIPTSK
jgi:NADP-dependent aldehyde dehydrogenase